MLGLVTTMGASHEGYLKLVQAAQDFADTVLATVSANPTRLVLSEGSETYPRDLESDTEKLRQKSVDVLFAPTPEVMYPESEVRVHFDSGPVAKILGGKTRPTHFVGVLLVIEKIFHLTRPDIACFDREDAQQLTVVTQMVKDLDFLI